MADPQKAATPPEKPPEYEFDKDKEPMAWAASQLPFVWPDDKLLAMKHINPNQKYPLQHYMPDTKTFKTVEVPGIDIRRAFATLNGYEACDTLFQVAPMEAEATTMLAMPDKIKAAITSEQKTVLDIITADTNIPAAEKTVLIANIKTKMMDAKAVDTLTKLPDSVSGEMQSNQQMASAAKYMIKTLNLVDTSKNPASPESDLAVVKMGKAIMDSAELPGEYTTYLKDQEKKPQQATPGKSSSGTVTPSTSGGLFDRANPLKGLLEGVAIPSLETAKQDSAGDFSVSNLALTAALKKVNEGQKAENQDSQLALAADPKPGLSPQAVAKNPVTQNKKSSSGVAA